MTAAPPDTPAFSAPRVVKAFLGVSLPAALVQQVSDHCAERGVPRSLYVEVALRRALALDAPATAPPQEP